MDYADILHRCFRCGYCKLPSDYSDITCPAYLNFRFETYSPGGRMWLLRGWLDGDIETSQRLAEIMYSCAACGNCVEHCVFPKFKDDLLNAFIAGREALVEEGLLPPGVRDYFKAMHVNGNPYKLPREDRGTWAEGLDIPEFDGQDFLFYVGDLGSFDDRGRRMARSVAALLKQAGVSIGILGANEKSDGNEVRVMGEKGLFELMARQTVDLFNDRGVKDIITLSPHAFHAFRKDYPKLGGEYGVRHYSQALSRETGRLPLDKTAEAIRVTYHDPCYLGRHNGEYLSPRRLLSSLPGVKLVEMDRRMADSLCCGGGDGNVFTDILGAGPDSPARHRVRDALATGADVLAVACPACARMLDDAVKAEEAGGRIRVMDLAELTLSRCVDASGI